MIRNCDAQGNPLPPLRQWWDAWQLLGEMIAFLFLAVVLLIVDLCEHFMGGRHIDTIMPDFNERLFMVKDTVPHYLRHMRICMKFLDEDKV